MKLKSLLLYIIVVLAASAPAYGARRKAAKTKLTAIELQAQAQQAFLNYNVPLAKEKLATLRADKKADAEIVASLSRQIGRMEEMIQRVQDVAVIDSFNVDREDFFRHYFLSPSCGQLHAAEELSPDLPRAEETVVFTPEEGRLIIWGTDSGLVESLRLTDGSWDTPRPLDPALNAGGTANYPYQLPDGSTLYFATDGDDSLGGLDIYITQRQRDGFAMAQNMGMPYNSPYDDYMLVIDEETGAGWFASDRNQLGDKVTIYVFIPTDTRVNIDINARDLAKRARIATLSPLTDQGKTVIEKIQNLRQARISSNDSSPDFEFALPSGRILRRWDDFRSRRALQLMENYVDALGDYDFDRKRLADLRQEYANGNRDASAEILALEKKLRASSPTLRRLANLVIQAETKND